VKRQPTPHQMRRILELLRSAGDVPELVEWIELTLATYPWALKKRRRPKKSVLNFDLDLMVLDIARLLSRERGGIPFRECVRPLVKFFYPKEAKKRVLRRLEDRGRKLERLPRIVWTKGKRLIIPPGEAAAPEPIPKPPKRQDRGPKK
jgi:hypothetical protein